MNRNLLNTLIYLIGFAVIWLFAYPLYSGGGYNMLGTSNLITEKYRKDDLTEAYTTAASIGNITNSNLVAYRNIDQLSMERIDKAIPSKIDIARMINNLDKLASASNLKASEFRYNKGVNKKLSNTGVYEISYTVTGNYADFRNHMRNIESSLEIYTIKKVSFSEVNDPTLAGKFKFSITLEAYELN
jgi:Tfp pilus assembly protein PilO